MLKKRDKIKEIIQKGVVLLNKRKAGYILGGLSILSAIISFIIFFIMRGPNTDIYFGITIFCIVSVLGILLAIFSLVMSKRLVLFIIGILGNGFVLVCAFLLLLAMGISEP